MNDEQHDPDEAMERFEDLGRRLFQVPKEQADRAQVHVTWLAHQRTGNTFTPPRPFRGLAAPRHEGQD